MSHDQLWAPWRLAYIETTPAVPAPAGDCFLCRYRAEDRDAENLVLLRTASSLVVLNRFPYNNGHLLVAPLAHFGGFEELSPEQLLDLQLVIARMLTRLRGALRPEGFNVGLNLGRVAGAGLPGHLHWHIVPRWNGDTNFMPVISDTKVVPQSLSALYDILRTAPEQEG